MYHLDTVFLWPLVLVLGAIGVLWMTTYYNLLPKRAKSIETVSSTIVQEILSKTSNISAIVKETKPVEVSLQVSHTKSQIDYLRAEWIEDQNNLNSTKDAIAEYKTFLFRPSSLRKEINPFFIIVTVQGSAVYVLNAFYRA